VIVVETTADALFEYLRNVIYNPENAKLNTEDLSAEFRDLGEGLQYFADCVIVTKAFAQALSRGELIDALPPSGNEIAAPLKSLHASLKHLTWQAQQIAQGDYNQRVDFMGEFSDAFNLMVEQLAERQKKLESKINEIQSKTNSLEQSNRLLTTLMHNVPQQIIVTDRNTREILLMNEIAANEVNNNADYFERILHHVDNKDYVDYGSEIEITYFQHGKRNRYLRINAFLVEWNNSNAEIFVINDVTATKTKIDSLESHAYYDSITRLYNRAFGMMTLNKWLDEKKQFVLIFADLDSLKYVNDAFGHNEGDIYIINAAKYLREFSESAVVSRVGGDEFIVLAQDIYYDEATKKMDEVLNKLQNDEYIRENPYSYSMSYGIAVIGKENELGASDLLSIADERMYENKRWRKRTRSN